MAKWTNHLGEIAMPAKSIMFKIKRRMACDPTIFHQNPGPVEISGALR
jgi:hypothetical protein